MRAASNVIGPLFLLALFALPVWLQVTGRSPFWLLPFGLLFPIFWLPHDRRARFEETARQLHGEKAGYVIFVKPAFMALWISAIIFGLTFALRQWIL